MSCADVRPLIAAYHDGELDLLVDFSEKYSAFNSILFLSSRAKGGDMVGQAAHFNHAGC